MTTVTMNNTQTSYIGLAKGPFKTRYNNHTKSRLFHGLNREIQHVLQDLKRIERDFDKAINLIEKRMDNIEVQNKLRDEKIKALEQKVEDLTKANKQHTDSINVQERFSRRNNIRIVGFPTSDGENLLEIAKVVLEKVGISNTSFEWAHCDGRLQPT